MTINNGNDLEPIDQHVYKSRICKHSSWCSHVVSPSAVKLPDVTLFGWSGRRALLGAPILEVDCHLVAPSLPLTLEQSVEARDVSPGACGIM